jgi:zinc/manganese transport system permease protein
VTLAVVSSYQAVGSLLVVGLLLAPSVAAGPWTTSIPTRMVVAVGFGWLAVVAGLLCSWYADTAAGASIAAAAIALAAVSAVAARTVSRWRRTADHSHAAETSARTLSRSGK